MLNEKQLDQRIHKFMGRKMETYPELRVVDMLSTSTLSDERRSPLYNHYKPHTNVHAWHRAAAM